MSTLLHEVLSFEVWPGTEQGCGAADGAVAGDEEKTDAGEGLDVCTQGVATCFAIHVFMHIR